MLRKTAISLLIFSLTTPAIVFAQKIKIQRFDRSDNSEKWHEHNDFLVPTSAELRGILALDFDSDGMVAGEDEDIDNDGILNEEDDDIDGDMVNNQYDPSPYDWRESGYNPFGVLVFLNWDHAWNNYMYEDDKLHRAVDSLKQLGVGFVRVDFSWEDIEPSKGDFNFEKYDKLVNLLTEHEVRILAIASYCNTWAGECWNGPPDNNQDFVDYFCATISRYKDKVKYWEIWNEPDSRTYWNKQDRMVTYTTLLTDCYNGAKEVDASCKIVLGGLTENSNVPLKHVYENGGGQYFDIVNIHPFVNPLKENRYQTLRSKINTVKRVMQEYNDSDKPIWLTELGAPGVENPTNKNGWWQGISPVENEQADWVEEIYTKGVEISQVEKIFWAFFQDTEDHFNNGVDSFGLVRGDFSLKPGYHIYKRCIQNWIKPEYSAIDSFRNDQQ